MGDMTRQEQEHAVARAYTEAHFDERTPEERGFSERFEKDFKPKLVANIGFNLDVAEAQRKRKKFFKRLLLALGPGLFLAALLLEIRGVERMLELWLYAFALVGTGGWMRVIRKRPEEEDPNHALLLGAILERFGCTVGAGAPRQHTVGKNAPVSPGHTSLRAMPDYVKGTFDGRMPFTAWRAEAWLKRGKSSTMSFKGWHLAVELPFSFSGLTVVVERDAAMLHRGTSMENVSLEDPDFSKRFKVLSNDQVEARVILAPDVMHHLLDGDRRLKQGQHLRIGSLLLGFSGSSAHVWIPSWETALSDWKPLHPAALVESLHDVFEEMSDLRAFLRDIDVIAESEGFRAQAAKNHASSYRVSS